MVCKNCRCNKCNGSGGWKNLRFTDVDINTSQVIPSHIETKYETKQLPTEHAYDYRARYLGMKQSEQRITTLIYHPPTTNLTCKLSGVCKYCNGIGKDDDKRNQNFWCRDCWISSFTLHGTLSLATGIIFLFRHISNGDLV